MSSLFQGSVQFGNADEAAAWTEKILKVSEVLATVAIVDRTVLFSLDEAYWRVGQLEKLLEAAGDRGGIGTATFHVPWPETHDEHLDQHLLTRWLVEPGGVVRTVFRTGT